MVKISSRQRPVFFNVLFCILVGCLAAHFLVDDLLLLPALGWWHASADTASDGSTSLPAYAEIDHQDDLMIQAALPERISDHAVSSAFEWTVLLEKQPSSPIFHPPEN